MSRDALVVGISRYYYDGLQDLRSPAEDAEAIAQRLEKYGDFQVWRLPEFLDPFDNNARRVARNQDVALDALEEALIRLFKPSGPSVPDTAIFFFSGHGLRKDRGIQEGYLATSDADPDRGNWGLSLQWLRRLLQESPIRQQVVWLDCCYSGELFNFMDEADPGDLGKGRDRCFIAASREYEAAYQDITGHSILTKALLEGLDPKHQPDGMVSNFVLTDWIKRGLKDTTQRPLYGNSGGQIILTGRTIETISFPLKGICPYKGLSYFDFDNEDPKYFYGRSILTDQLLEAVRQSNILAVLGASGSGKSSVVRAGLLHQLRQGQHLSDSDQWPIYILSPGEHPLQSLAWAFVDSALSDIDRASQLAKATDLIEAGSVGLGHLIHASAKGKRIVLVIDQLEEIFTLCHNEVERQQFFDCLLGTLKQVEYKLCLILVMRADFFSKCTEHGYAGLAHVMQESLITVTPMNREELEQAIIEPAKQVGLEVERELVSQILDDIEGPGSLPLLEYALTQLWHHRTVNRLTLAEYTRLGGVKGTLQRRADEVYHSLSAQEQQVAKRIFLELTQLGEGTEDTRRRVFQQDLVTSPDLEEQVSQVVQRLTDAKLLITSEVIKKGPNPDRFAVVDIAHEALIRHWPRLRSWIGENRAKLRVQRQIEAAAKLWQHHGRQTDFLLQGVRLSEAEEIYLNYKDDLSEEVQTFIGVGITQRQQQQQREQKRLRQAQLTATAMGILSLVALIFGAAAYWQGQRALQNEIQALNSSSQAYLASNQQLEALIASVKAGQRIQYRSWVSVIPEALRRETTQGLRQVIDEIRERNRLEGHAESVTNINFSHDGRLMASASADATAKLWQRDGQAIQVLQKHRDVVTSTSFNPNDQIIATASVDGTIGLWRYDGTELRVLHNGSKAIWDVQFSPNGQMLASASADNTIKLWNLNGEVLQTLQGHQDSVTSIDFSPNGQMLASASADNTIKLWNLDGEVLQTLSGHQDSVTSISFSPDGQMLASASADSTIKLWNLNGEVLQTLSGHQDSVTSVSFSPDGQMLASSSEDHTIKIWTIAEGREVETLRGHTAEVTTVSFNLDGMLVSASADKSIRIWDIATVDLNTSYQGQTRQILDVEFSPDGRTIASAGTAKKIELWHETGQRFATLEGHRDWIVDLDFSPDGQTIASASHDQTIKLWDRDELLATLEGHKGPVNSVSFSPDGQIIASASDDTTIKLWSVDGTELQMLEGHSKPVYDVQFSPDGDAIASTGADKTIRIWSRKGELLRTLQGHQDIVWAVDFSPDGLLLASAGDDKTVRLWGLKGKLIHTLEEHSGWVLDVEFSPNGQLLASAGGDRTVKIWNVSSQQVLKTLRGHRDEVWSLSFSPDGQILASAGLDGTVKLWGWDSTQPNDISLNELLLSGCDWLHDYLENNSRLADRDRTLCQS